MRSEYKQAYIYYKLIPRYRSEAESVNAFTKRRVKFNDSTSLRFSQKHDETWMFPVNRIRCASPEAAKLQGSLPACELSKHSYTLPLFSFHIYLINMFMQFLRWLWRNRFYSSDFREPLIEILWNECIFECVYRYLYAWQNESWNMKRFV